MACARLHSQNCDMFGVGITLSKSFTGFYAKLKFADIFFKYCAPALPSNSFGIEGVLSRAAFYLEESNISNHVFLSQSSIGLTRT